MKCKPRIRKNEEVDQSFLGEVLLKIIQALLGVPHSKIQVELGFILQAGTCQILNFAQNHDEVKTRLC